MKEYVMALDQGTTSSRCILFDKKGNLLDLIERKASEIMMDSTTDLIKAGLYDS